jgi:hypothetical protein
MLESLEMIIIKNESDPGKVFWSDFIDRIPLEIEECKENITTTQRALLSVERERSKIAVAGLASNLTIAGKQRSDTRYELMLESLITSYRNMDDYRKMINVLEELRKKEGDR